MVYVPAVGSYHRSRTGSFPPDNVVFTTTPPPDTTNFVDQGAVRDSVEIGRREGTAVLTVGWIAIDDLHHAHHGRLHEIVTLIGKPGGTEPCNGSCQVLPQLRIVYVARLRWQRGGGRSGPGPDAQSSMHPRAPE